MPHYEILETQHVLSPQEETDVVGAGAVVVEWITQQVGDTTLEPVYDALYNPLMKTTILSAAIVLFVWHICAFLHYLRCRYIVKR